MHRCSSVAVTTALVVAVAVGGCGATAPLPASTPPAPPPPAGSPPPAVPSNPAANLPGELLDLSNWFLTLPTGGEEDPQSIFQPELDTYSSEYFQLDAARTGVVFTTPAGGTTTSGSSYPRTELREMFGEEKASWSNRSGRHTLTVRQAVTALPPVKPEVVVAQIHDGDDDVVLVRVEGSRLLVEYDDGDGEVMLDPAYRLGALYDLEIVAEGGRILVSYQGGPPAVVDLEGSGWYFKTGAYLQSNTERGDAPDSVGQVVLQSLRVTHSE